MHVLESGYVYIPVRRKSSVTALGDEHAALYEGMYPGFVYRGDWNSDIVINDTAMQNVLWLRAPESALSFARDANNDSGHESSDTAYRRSTTYIPYTNIEALVQGQIPQLADQWDNDTVLEPVTVDAGIVDMALQVS